jgi:hypothetical protein
VRYVQIEAKNDIKLGKEKRFKEDKKEEKLLDINPNYNFI